MGTRSLVGYRQKIDGSFKLAYCHHDSYPHRMMRVLNSSYGSAEEATKLVENGGYSFIGNSTQDCVRNNVKNMLFRDINEDDNLMSEKSKDYLWKEALHYYYPDYIYMWDDAKNIWYWTNYIDRVWRHRFCDRRKVFDEEKKIIYWISLEDYIKDCDNL